MLKACAGLRTAFFIKKLNNLCKVIKSKINVFGIFVYLDINERRKSGIEHLTPGFSSPGTNAEKALEECNGRKSLASNYRKDCGKRVEDLIHCTQEQAQSCSTETEVTWEETTALQKSSFCFVIANVPGII